MLPLLSNWYESLLSLPGSPVACNNHAEILHHQTNCLTEMFFDLALDRAKAVDEYMEKNGKPMGPFHGLPISVKVSYNSCNVFTHH